MSQKLSSTLPLPLTLFVFFILNITGSNQIGIAMALHLAALAAGGANTDFLNAFQPSAEKVAARSEFPKAVVARNDSGVPTVNMFVDGGSSDLEYAASVIGACNGQTTYAIRCTAGSDTPSFLLENPCGPNAVAATATVGPDTYRVSTAVSTKSAGHTAAATVEEACSLRGTTEAVCTATVDLSLDKERSSTNTVLTLSGSSYYRYDVAITAGAEKLASPTGQCQPASGSGASTKAVALWTLVGVVGLASLW
ncbi:hypothetical protein QBC42DRAFT_294589 [Cladorrhinum samala]|uniref:Uncharacterized protein n=1 Tax=Cladorrhinum samala TaxID=585594 RepID=A0AAV9HW27_9PEZI|nr:hypothetical protein QBC42DRAFT_294589 [Cladorrhinum samala]